MRRLLTPILLVVLAFAERAAYLGTKGILVFFLLVHPADGGLGLERLEAVAAYQRMAAWGPLCLLAGGLVALAAGPGLTMALGAGLLAVACFGLATAADASLMLWLGGLALGYGLFHPALYAAAGSAVRAARPERRLAFFYLLYLGVSAGGVAGPALLEGFAAVHGMLGTFRASAAGLAVVTLLSLAAALLGRRAESPAAGPANLRPGMVVPAAAFFAALFWLAFETVLSWRAPHLAAWSEAGHDVGWLHTLDGGALLPLCALAALACLLRERAGSARGALRSAALALGLMAAAVLLHGSLVGEATAAGPATGRLALASLLMALGEVLLVPLLAFAATALPRRFATLAVAVYLALVTTPTLFGLAQPGPAGVSTGTVWAFALALALAGTGLFVLAPRAARWSGESAAGAAVVDSP